VSVAGVNNGEKVRTHACLCVPDVDMAAVETSKEPRLGRMEVDALDALRVQQSLALCADIMRPRTQSQRKENQRTVTCKSISRSDEGRSETSTSTGKNLDVCTRIRSSKLKGRCFWTLDTIGLSDLSSGVRGPPLPRSRWHRRIRTRCIEQASCPCGP
jgi:hypothetical protein